MVYFIPEIDLDVMWTEIICRTNLIPKFRDLQLMVMEKHAGHNVTIQRQWGVGSKIFRVKTLAVHRNKRIEQ